MIRHRIIMIGVIQSGFRGGILYGKADINY